MKTVEKPRTERIGDCSLFLADCRDVLPLLEKVDAIVTDPPYGIGESGSRNRTRGTSSAKWKKAGVTDYGNDDWDREPCPAEVIAWMRANSTYQIIFGGNFFDLPPASCWLVWDKENTGDFADGELAWTNLPKAVRIIRWMWNGFQRKGGEKRFHLTQKPLGVMQWCLSHIPDAKTVCDPFMGSGTTGVACALEGRTFIGVERELRYFDVACSRIENAYRQPRLIDPGPPKAAVQIRLDFETATVNFDG